MVKFFFFESTLHKGPGSLSSTYKKIPWKIYFLESTFHRGPEKLLSTYKGKSFWTELSRNSGSVCLTILNYGSVCTAILDDFGSVFTAVLDNSDSVWTVIP